VKYRSEGKDKREESKKPVDGGARKTCKGEDDRATDDWSPQVVFPSPLPSSSPSASVSPASPRSLTLFLASFASASTPTDLCSASSPFGCSSLCVVSST
jgi:hypothetical protein